jgi:hypothetical protein
MERGLDTSRLPIKEGLAIALSAVAVTGAKETSVAEATFNDAAPQERSFDDMSFGAQDLGKLSMPSTVSFENVSYSYSPKGSNTTKAEVTYAHTASKPTHHTQKHGAKYPHVRYGSIWDKLAACESTSNWKINSGNGFYGGIQFTLSSWKAVGGKGYPHWASRDQQIYRGKKLQHVQGWGAWPVCSRKIGLR